MPLSFKHLEEKVFEVSQHRIRFLSPIKQQMIFNKLAQKRDKFIDNFIKTTGLTVPVFLKNYQIELSPIGINYWKKSYGMSAIIKQKCKLLPIHEEAAK